MNKGISFYFGFILNQELTVKLIKEAGFTAVITNADKNLTIKMAVLESKLSYLKNTALSFPVCICNITKMNYPTFGKKEK